MNTPELPTSRQRLTDTMEELLRRQGYAATGLSQLLNDAQAPKGVLYHHFPGGKQALAQAAIEAATVKVLAALEQLFVRAPDPLDAIELWSQNAAHMLKKSQFARGCPFATIALEAAATDDVLQLALEAAFSAMRARISVQFEHNGIDTARAQAWATLILSTYEGGLLLARAQRSTAPLLEAMGTLRVLLQPCLEPTP
jgi:TetR/AcrR family transcriptional regulator, lmrAB and yxaGH operons repressor